MGGCIGPGGTRYTAARLYSWGQWNTRNFVKESLMTLFPDKHKEIKEHVDPGEYGLEDYFVRIAAVFVFMVSVMEELFCIARIVKLLWLVPTRAESWIFYEGDMASDAVPRVRD